MVYHSATKKKGVDKQVSLLSSSRKSKIEDQRHQLFSELHEPGTPVCLNQVRKLVDECNLKLEEDPHGNFEQVTSVLCDQMNLFAAEQNRELIHYSHHTKLANRLYFLFESSVQRSGLNPVPPLQVVGSMLQGVDAGICFGDDCSLIVGLGECLMSKCLETLALVRLLDPQMPLQHPPQQPSSPSLFSGESLDS